MKRILITGGSGGIGTATTRVAAERGYWPLVGYASNRQGALQAVIAAGAGEVVRLDLLEPDWDLTALGEVHAVAHCAGRYSLERTLLANDSVETQKLMEVNALAPLRLTRALLDLNCGLRHCTMVLSTAVSCVGGGPYALSKATGLAMCKLLARELAPRDVRVHAIVPGWIDTPMAVAAAIACGRTIGQVRTEHPDGKLLDPEDVARLLLDLIDDSQQFLECQLVSWDLRDAPMPVWAALDTVSLPATRGTETLEYSGRLRGEDGKEQS